MLYACDCYSHHIDCLKRIDEHNGDIKYVSLCKHTNDWIVGYGNNGYSNGGGLCTELTSFLSGINASRKSINLVELGGNNHYFIDHENGYKWSMNSELSSWFKYRDSDNSFSTISLWKLYEHFILFFVKMCVNVC